MDGLTYSISEASELLGISYRTLHYYEQKFDLSINRDSSGNRYYYEYDIELFDKIVQLKKKGMKLDGIKTLFQEKGLLPVNRESKVMVIDEKVSAKQLLIQEIQNAVSEQMRRELQNTNSKLDLIINENNELREEVRQLLRESDEHYRKIDRKITQWRECASQPWFKRIFHKI